MNPHWTLFIIVQHPSHLSDFTSSSRWISFWSKAIYICPFAAKLRITGRQLKKPKTRKTMLLKKSAFLICLTLVDWTPQAKDSLWTSWTMIRVEDESWHISRLEAGWRRSKHFGCFLLPELSRFLRLTQTCSNDYNPNDFGCFYTKSL